MLDYTTLKVGDQVAVARSGGWSIMNEGVYRVVKVNKVKVVVERVSDGYQREFSVKRRCEMKSNDHYRAGYLETVAAQEARIEAREREAAVRNAWRKVETAAAQRDLNTLRQSVAALEALVDPVPF